MTTDKREAEIRERAERATPGPWITDHVNSRGRPYRMYAVPGVDWNDNAMGGDQEFIAHARDDIPWLLDQLATLRQSLSAAEARVKGDDVAIKLPKYAVRYLRGMCKREREALNTVGVLSLQSEASYDSLDQIEYALPDPEPWEVDAARASD